MFADAGATFLFSHLIIPLSRATEAGDKIREGRFVLKNTRWSDLTLSQDMEYVAKLAASRFAHHVKTVSFRFTSHPLPLNKNDITELEPAKFARLSNISTARLIIPDRGQLMSDEDKDFFRDFIYWMPPIRNFAIEGRTKLQRILLDVPDWALAWLPTQMPISTFHIELTRHGLPGTWHPGRHSPIIADLRSLYLTCDLAKGPHDRRLSGKTRLQFDGLTCHNLRELTLKQVQVNESFAGFIQRCKRTLQELELEQPLGQPEITRNFDWGPVFQALSQCPYLRMLKLGNACLRVSNDSTIDLQMPRLLSLGLLGVTLHRVFFLRLIQSNQETLYSVSLLGVNLDNMGVGEWHPPASNWKDPDWVSVFKTLKACPRLNQMFIHDLQNWFSVEARKDPGVLDLFKAMSDPNSASTIPLPDAARFVIHSKTNDFAANMDSYHKLGELIRLVLAQNGNDWDRIQPPWCKKWLASLHPLADIRSGKATSTDVFSEDQWTQAEEIESASEEAVVASTAATAAKEEL